MGSYTQSLGDQDISWGHTCMSQFVSHNLEYVTICKSQFSARNRI